MGVMNGFRIIEIGSWAAVPGAGAMLADWGADVIKVENPRGGDPSRGYVAMEVDLLSLGYSPFFEQANRNKRSIAVDLNSIEGQTIIHRLVKTSDVILTNYLPHVLTQLRMDYPTLSNINPKLVYISLTGYGHKGIAKDKPGFDYAAFWAYSGIMGSLAEPGAPPVQQRPAMGDFTNSLAVAGAASAALLGRERQGIGQEVRLSLWGTALWINSRGIQGAMVSRKDLTQPSRKCARNPLFNYYQLADGQWLTLVMLQSQKYWASFCQAIEREELINDLRFSTHALREKHSEELVAILDDTFAQKRLQELGPRLDEHGAIWAPVRKLTDVANDAEAWNNGYFFEVDHPTGTSASLISAPAQFNQTPAEVRCVAPELGQHTEEILQLLGYTWDEIAGLKQGGVIL